MERCNPGSRRGLSLVAQLAERWTKSRPRVSSLDMLAVPWFHVEEGSPGLGDWNARVDVSLRTTPPPPRPHWEGLEDVSFTHCKKEISPQISGRASGDHRSL